MTYLKIKRKDIFNVMKTIMFLVPTGIMTSNIFVNKYGGYYLSLNQGLIPDSIDIEKTVFAISLFCFLSLVFYAIESFVIPTIISFTHKSIAILGEDEISKNRYGYNIFEKVKELYPEIKIRNDALQHFSYFIVVGALWLIAFNTFASLMCLIPFFIMSYYFLSIILSVLKKVGL